MRAMLSWAASAASSTVLLLAFGAPAGAIQFTPDSDDRLNTFQSGAPGTPFNTPTGGVDFAGTGTGDPHPGEVVVTGDIPQLNFFDGSAQDSVTFGTPIDFRLEAELIGATVAGVGGGLVQFSATFQGTADGDPDVTLTDPTTGTVLLEANLVGGTLGSTPVDPITVLSAPFDPNNIPAQPNLQGFAFFQTQVSGNPWEILFSDDVGALNDPGIAQALISNFMPDFAQIASNLVQTGNLPSLEAEANGTIFALSGSQFQVPEPATAWLLAGGLLGLWLAGRRSAAKA